MCDLQVSLGVVGGWPAWGFILITTSQIPSSVLTPPPPFSPHLMIAATTPFWVTNLLLHVWQSCLRNPGKAPPDQSTGCLAWPPEESSIGWHCVSQSESQPGLARHPREQPVFEEDVFLQGKDFYSEPGRRLVDILVGLVLHWERGCLGDLLSDSWR